MLIAWHYNLNFEAPDVFIKKLTSKRINVTVLNHSSTKMTLLKCTQLGDMTEVEENLTSVNLRHKMLNK